MKMNEYVADAAVNLHMDTCRSTPLHLSAMYGHAEVVELLLERGTVVKRTKQTGFKLKQTLYLSLYLSFDCRIVGSKST